MTDVITDRVLKDLHDERTRQDERHGGPSHDDTHSTIKWIGIIRDLTNDCYVIALIPNDPLTRKYIVQIAVAAIAAAQVLDRIEAADHAS